MQCDSEKADKITGGACACACNDDKVIFENPLNWTTRSFIFAKQREYENGPPTPEPRGELSCEAATEENAPRTQVTGEANFSPGMTSGLPVIRARPRQRQRDQISRQPTYSVRCSLRAASRIISIGKQQTP